MHADLDTLCTVVYCTADDLLPEKPGNARRRVTDAEVATLCVAQAIMGIPSDRRFLAVARKWLGDLFPELPQQPGFHKRRARPTETIEWLIGVFAAQSPGFHDDLLIDSTPVECARSVETARRSALAEAADYGRCASHSRFFWGFRLHGLFAPDGTPRAFTLASPKRDEREVGLELLGRVNRVGGEILIGDKGYAGRAFAEAVAGMGATIVRPARKDEPKGAIHLAPIRQRVESIFWTCKDILTLKRHGARTLASLRVRIAQRFLALAACISLNHRLGRPSRALVDYVA
jgi:Transposase DDE domain